MNYSMKEVHDPSMPGLEVVQPGLELAYSHQNHITKYPGGNITNQPGGAETPRVCGLRKVTFWLVMAVVALSAIATGLGIGLGVGLSNARRSSQDESPVESHGTGSSTSSTPSGATPSSSDSSDPTTGTSTGTTTGTSSSMATSPTRNPTVSSVCPDRNGTIVNSSPGSMQYRVLCDSDFDGSGKETLSSVVLSSFVDCVAVCNTMNYFQDRTDIGATFNVAGTGTQTPGTCWCLGGADKVVVKNVGNDAAVPL